MKNSFKFFGAVSVGFLLASCGSSGGGDKTPEIDTSKLAGDVYYHVQNPKTQNQQLLSYNWDKNKAFVVNDNIILGSSNKMFLVQKEVDADGFVVEKSFSKGIYLDPTLDKETKTAKDHRGKEYSYNFYKDNALKIFDTKLPKQATTLFSSQDIPQSLKTAGIKVLGKTYEIVQIADKNFVTIVAYDKMADAIAKEKFSDRKTAYITFDIDTKASFNGKILGLTLDNKALKTLVINVVDPFVPKDNNANWKLQTISADLKTANDITNGAGEFFKASENTANLYFYKTGSTNFFTLPKTDLTDLKTVTGATIAGNFDQAVFGAKSLHGAVGGVGASSTLSGLNKSLSDGTNAYALINYNLHSDAGTAPMFGKFALYKSAQVFKLSGTTATKIFDNGNGTDKSGKSATNTEKAKGHLNLVAVSGDKIFVEVGNYEGNANIWDGTACTAKFGKTQIPSCFTLAYGSISASANPTATAITPLQIETKDLVVKDLPYFVARRMPPFMINDKLVITTFNGGSKMQGGYRYAQAIYSNTGAYESNKTGRTYVVASGGVAPSGKIKGDVISWDQSKNTITNQDGSISISAKIAGLDSKSISSQINSIPYSGIGVLGMFQDDAGATGKHEFRLFVLSTKGKGEARLTAKIPYSQWIYE